MAIIANVSSPTSGTESVFGLITSLCSAGWRVKAWSDATTLTSGVSLSSNPYGSASSGANNLGNTSAWFRISAPDGSREWLFQRGSADQTWTISRSVVGFTGGTPSATTAGTASDATALFSAAQVFPTSQWRQFVSLDDASPYGFTVYGITLGGGNVLAFIADEPLLTGTTASEDTDPYLWIGYYNGTGFSAAGGTNGFVLHTNGSCIGYKRWLSTTNARVAYGMIWDIAAWGIVAPAQNTSNTQFGPTPSGVKEVPIRIPVYRNAAASTSSGWCGFTSRHRWCTVGGRANGDKLVDGATNWIYAAGVWVPWDSTTPTLS